MMRLTETAPNIGYKLTNFRLMLVREGPQSKRRVVVRNPTDAARFLQPLRHSSEERFVSLHLNAKHEIIGLHEVSHGTISASLVHPREVFKAALLANSFALIVCHNHPSGAHIVPSKEDIDTTKQLLDAGRLLGVALIDHLIVGPVQKRAYSIKENHPELWGLP